MSEFPIVIWRVLHSPVKVKVTVTLHIMLCIFINLLYIIFKHIYRRVCDLLLALRAEFKHSYGQVGIGDPLAKVGSLPTQMGSSLPVVQLGTSRSAISVSAGHYHTCAVLDNKVCRVLSLRCFTYSSCWLDAEFAQVYESSLHTHICNGCVLSFGATYYTCMCMRKSHV